MKSNGIPFRDDVDPSNATDRRLPAPRPNRWLPKELATVSSMTIDTHTGTVYVTEFNGRIVASHY